MSAGTFVTNDATHCDKHKKVAKKRSLGLVIKKIPVETQDRTVIQTKGPPSERKFQLNARERSRKQGEKRSVISSFVRLFLTPSCHRKAAGGDQNPRSWWGE